MEVKYKILIGMIICGIFLGILIPCLFFYDDWVSYRQYLDRTPQHQGIIIDKDKDFWITYIYIHNQDGTVITIPQYWYDYDFLLLDDITGQSVWVDVTMTQYDIYKIGDNISYFMSGRIELNE